MHRSIDMDANINHKTDVLTKILMVLAIIGAVNWGLIGFFNFNLVDAIFGGGSAEMTSAGSRMIYALVGLAGLASLVLLPRLHATSSERGRYADRAI